jgi:hypothetical protein
MVLSRPVSPWWDRGLLQASHVSLTDRVLGAAGARRVETRRRCHPVAGEVNVQREVAQRGLTPLAGSPPSCEHPLAHPLAHLPPSSFRCSANSFRCSANAASAFAEAARQARRSG